MKKILLFLLTTILFFGCSEEKYPDGFGNDLPFGLNYYISKTEAKYVLDSLIKKETLFLPYKGSSSYDYELTLPEGSIRLSVSLSFHNDSLYQIHIEDNNSNRESEKENKRNATAFFKSQEIDLNSYSKSHDKITYVWKKQEHEISLHHYIRFSIVYSDGYISKRRREENLERVTKEAMERYE
jgi:hypothetical protein